MLRCGTSKLTRSSHFTNSSISFQLLPINRTKHKQNNNNPYYHQSVFNSQTRSQLKESQLTPMSGSALDTIQDVLALIDSFQVKVDNNELESQQSQFYQSNQNLPKFLIDTSIPFSHQTQ